jgi:hypothetical protein
LLGIKAVRPSFYQQFAASKDKSEDHHCENTLLLLMKLLKAEDRGGGIRHNLAKQYVDIDKQSCLILDGNHPVHSALLRQIYLWTSLKHEPEATRKAKLSPVGPVTREGVEYKETYLIQRLRPQKCTECAKICNCLGMAQLSRAEARNRETPVPGRLQDIMGTGPTHDGSHGGKTARMSSTQMRR